MATSDELRAGVYPTTDCQTCGRTAKECGESHAKGWDGCCMTCDEQGRRVSHRLRAEGKRL